MKSMRRSLVARDLDPIPAAALIAVVALALFGWTERTVVVDPDGMSVSHWPWRLWQLGALVIGVGGIWWIRLGTERVRWLRSLALALLAAAIFANAYTGLFGDHAGNVWRTVNPLYIGVASVAAVLLWRSGDLSARCAALLSASLGSLVFANAYFVDEGVSWQILNPAMFLTAVASAGLASTPAAGSGRRRHRD